MFRKLLFACLLGLTFASSTFAASVLPLMLDEIIDTAVVAFQGICTANRTERDSVSGFAVTYTTFDVNDVIKGSVGKTHLIKQIGGIMPAGELSFVVHGVPKFKVGEEYVVFLAGVSSAGFSSPIGLSQGKFTVLKSDAGTKVTNGRDFGEMTKRVVSQGSGTAVAPPNQLALEEFKRLARTRVSNSQ